MRYVKYVRISILIFYCVLINGSNYGLASNTLGDPYKILGLTRQASLQDIRKAYKQLAKEW